MTRDELKTPIEELIDYVNNRPLTKTGKKSFAQVIPYGEVINLAKELLEKEKDLQELAVIEGNIETLKNILSLVLSNLSRDVVNITIRELETTRQTLLTKLGLDE